MTLEALCNFFHKVNFYNSRRKDDQLHLRKRKLLARVK